MKFIEVDEDNDYSYESCTRVVYVREVSGRNRAPEIGRNP
jgi:hypothetical protein